MHDRKVPYFPLFIDLTKKKILIIGLGNIAMRRIRTLISFSPEIIVITKAIRSEYRKETETFMKEGKIKCCLKEFEDTDLSYTPDIVIAATENAALNARIGRIARQKGALVNVASDESMCDFYFPAVALTEDIIAGVTGNGRNHEKVAQVTEDIRHLLRRL